MSSILPQKSLEDIHELRKEAGIWIKELRERKGLSQRDLADQTGTEYYTFVSQLETGRGRIPSENYMKWANALGVDPKVFVKTLMQFYEPVTYNLLFPTQADAAAE